MDESQKLLVIRNYVSQPNIRQTHTMLFFGDAGIFRSHIKSMFSGCGYGEWYYYNIYG